MFRADVAASRELQATVALLKAAPSRIRTYMKQAARKRLNQLWRPALQARVGSKLQRRAILAGARAKVENDTFSMLAATRTTALSGGLVPADQWHGPELGMVPKQREVRIAGRVRSQAIGRNFGWRNPQGKVAYPAAREVGPEAVQAWTEAVVAGAVKGTAAETVKVR